MRKRTGMIHSPINLDFGVSSIYIYTSDRAIYWFVFDAMLLGCQCSAGILFIGLVLVLAQPPTKLPRQYIVRRDLFTVMRASQFSIMDPSEKKLYYRIESAQHLLQRVKVIRYPEKVQTARLAEKFHALKYHGDFSILNETTNRWIDGVIDKGMQWLHFSSAIQWNGYQINVTGTEKPLSLEFRDESDELLAEYRLQVSVSFWKRYHVKVYTNEYPEEIYLLALAALDGQVTAKNPHLRRQKGKKQWTNKQCVLLFLLNAFDMRYPSDYRWWCHWAD